MSPVIKDLAPCSYCHEGFEINPNTGGRIPCRICKGFGFVTPHNVCYCGLSCNTTSGEHNFCGDPKCLEGLKQAALISEYGNRRPYWSSEDFNLNKKVWEN